MRICEKKKGVMRVRGFGARLALGSLSGSLSGPPGRASPLGVFFAAFAAFELWAFFSYVAFFIDSCPLFRQARAKTLVFVPAPL